MHVEQSSRADQQDKKFLCVEDKVQQKFLMYVSSQPQMQELLRDSLGALTQKVCDEMNLNGQDKSTLSESQIARWCSRFAYEAKRTEEIAIRNELRWKIDHPTKDFGVHEQIEVKKSAENLSAIESRLFHEKLKQGEERPPLQDIRRQAFTELQEQLNTARTLTNQWVENGVHGQIAQAVSQSLIKFEAIHGDRGKRQEISVDQIKTLAKVLGDKVHSQETGRRTGAELILEKTELYQLSKLADANIRSLKTDGKLLDSPTMDALAREALQDLQRKEQAQVAERNQEREAVKSNSREI